MSGCITPPCLLRACSGASLCALLCAQKHTAANNAKQHQLCATVIYGSSGNKSGIWAFLYLQMTPQMLPQTL